VLGSYQLVLELLIGVSKWVTYYKGILPMRESGKVVEHIGSLAYIEYKTTISNIELNLIFTYCVFEITRKLELMFLNNIDKHVKVKNTKRNIGQLKKRIRSIKTRSRIRIGVNN